MTTVMLIVAGLLVLKLAAEWGLDLLNRQQVLRHADRAPEGLREVVDEPTYRKAVDYTLAKNRFSMLESGFSAVVLAAVVFSGVLPWIYELFGEGPGRPAWLGALYLIAVMTGLSLVSLPLDWWSQFRLEERFGFNKSTPGLWAADKVKGALVGFVLGFPLIWVLLALVNWTGSAWWIWGFAVFFGFQLVMMIVYPMFVMPLFNKFTPLPDGELKTALMELADRTGFRAKTILVMDGSRRSAHSNAFFTGFGRFRRIVLYDTLMEQLGRPELAAVLAHEIGHYKKGHIPRMLGISAVLVFGAFALIAWLAGQDWFYAGFGFDPETAGLAPAFLLFGLLSGLVSFWLSPLFNLMSRKHEYEADEFARAAVGEADPLIGALRKLSEKNLSNLTPHPLYSGFYYSHPTLLERETALRGS